MRRVVPTFLMAAALAFANGQMTFSLTSDKKEYRSGNPILFTWKLTNGTERTWLVYVEHIPAGYDQITLRIEGPSGVRSIIPASLESAASTIAACWLSPGRTLQGTFELTQWAAQFHYPMPPGRYTISGVFEHSRQNLKRVLVGFPAPVCGAPEGPLKTGTAEDVLDAHPASPPLVFIIR